MICVNESDVCWTHKRPYMRCVLDNAYNAQNVDKTRQSVPNCHEKPQTKRNFAGTRLALLAGDASEATLLDSLLEWDGTFLTCEKG